MGLAGRREFELQEVTGERIFTYLQQSLVPQLNTMKSFSLENNNAFVDLVWFYRAFYDYFVDDKTGAD